ncbi:uncharacterized protein METZ01_LOCUS474655 [marine metagenome]|uniref:Uncharacterized protein n=1 Tax=marine metagenome TaxID=408172 RepID=A0A383BPL3_9ZZZZ
MVTEAGDQQSRQGLMNHLPLAGQNQKEASPTLLH